MQKRFDLETRVKRDRFQRIPTRLTDGTDHQLFCSVDDVIQQAAVSREVVDGEFVPLNVRQQLVEDVVVLVVVAKTGGSQKLQRSMNACVTRVTSRDHHIQEAADTCTPVLSSL